MPQKKKFGKPCWETKPTVNGQKRLCQALIMLDTTEEHKEMFDNSWQEALKKLKELAEKQ
jgi:hypothetical protein